MSTIRIKGKLNEIEMVKPEDTYFVAHYTDHIVKGGGLEDTGWEQLEDGIIKLEYHLSTGHVIEIPQLFEKYLHLVEVSRSLLDDRVVYHFVFIKAALGKRVISYRISLKTDEKAGLHIGDIHIEEDTDVTLLKIPHWKKAEVI